MIRSNKIGFFSVFALVISSQIGSGIFILPISLAPYGVYAPISWIISGFGAICLTLVFAILCSKFPETGGPHIYVKYVFGNTIAFFVGWTYWVISWVSTTAVVIASISYFVSFCSNGKIQNINLILEIMLMIFIMLINLRGITIVGYIEVILMIIKISALLIIPTIVIFYFSINHLFVSEKLLHLTTTQLLARSTLLTLWCFIGLESATISADSVNNPIKIIPRAMILGTILVAFIYLFNSVAIMGLIDSKELAISQAPYFDAMQMIFYGISGQIIISIIVMIVCISSLNAWVLGSGQVALSLAKEKFMPQIFTTRNKYGAPIWGISMSVLGTCLLLMLTASKNFAQQITFIINISVVSYLFVYLVCSLVFLTIMAQEKCYFKLWIGIIAISFCIWLICTLSVNILLIASLFTVSGIPIYLLWYRKMVLS
ncbi:APC family permease [Wolbachia endosymbiont of Howardula sp.]|uniref:APC family permease n=1 Tax=Wolbachia endosymbiont of Howardula sp. TaxID=2916816 RepID=UPI00217D768C|nr:amino acid permease [Wolbachia endosymbiont of Howardula sp.]UWI83352.1 amino acid permease [Wolbachia endosymbiont of Howardula sp.]